MMKVKCEVVAGVSSDGMGETRTQWYDGPEGLRRVELRSVQGESDFSNGMWRRASEDNGRTWGEWENVYDAYFQALGSDEVIYLDVDPAEYNPVYGHYVSMQMQRIFIGGHTAAYKRYWAKGENSFKDHCSVVVTKPGGGVVAKQPVQYEEGAGYDAGRHDDPDYLDRNQCYFGRVKVLKNGDIAFPVGASMLSCCRLLGLDVNDVFPSCPQIMCGLIVGRGRWNAGEGRYSLSYSRPVVISDLLSSRAVCEPVLAELESGRLLVVFRGSNVASEAWNTRIGPSAPNVKWYTFSDDGGKTFSPALPWHFNSREYAYSSATISEFVRSEKNGKLYWVGNITDPVKTDGNYPRWPLHICQVDETHGVLMRETLTVVDTKREGESDRLQLSNFSILQDRESGDIEIRLAKVGQFTEKLGSAWKCESVKYTVTL